MGTNGYSFRTSKLCPKVEEEVSREMEKEVGDNEQLLQLEQGINELNGSDS